MKKGFSRKRLVMIGCVLTAILLLFVFEKAIMKKNNAHPDPNDNVLALPYRTINSLDTTQHLLAYEFHKSESDGMRYIDCSAVIRNIDPAKDDYKTYCKSVIADIERTLGTERIQLAIYDDYEAYVLSEVQNGQQFKVLNKNETDSVDKHTVATYVGKIDEYEGTLTLMFYPEARNHYTEKEIYEP